MTHLAFGKLPNCQIVSLTDLLVKNYQLHFTMVIVVNTTISMHFTSTMVASAWLKTASSQLRRFF